MKDKAQANPVIAAAWITSILGCVGVVLAAVVGLGLPVIQNMTGPKELTAISLTTGEPAVPTQPPIQSNAECQEIIGRLPALPEEIRSQFGIAADKPISIIYEICPEAPNGFIIGESPSLVTLQVPGGGCIDSYSGASFSEATVPEHVGGGRRAFSGSVTTTSLTYRIAGCEQKP